MSINAKLTPSMFNKLGEIWDKNNRKAIAAHLKFDIFEVDQHPNWFKEIVEEHNRKLDEGMELPPFNLKTIQEMLDNFYIPYPVISDFPMSDDRKSQRRPYILIDDTAKIGFSRKDAFKRAILLQTDLFAFVPKPGFRCLELGLDFDFVQVGTGNKARTDIYVTPTIFTRCVYGKLSDFEPDDGLTSMERFKRRQAEQQAEYFEKIEYEAYDRVESIRERIIAIFGYCPGFKQPNIFWTLERELKRGKPVCPWENNRNEVITNWCKTRNEAVGFELYLTDPQAIAQFRLRIAANRKARNTQRMQAILGKHSWLLD